MDLTKEKPAVGAGGQYSTNGSYTTAVVSQNQLEIQQAFLEDMRQAGIICPAPIVSDGRIHRFAQEGKGAKDGWYVFYGAAGAYGDWSKGIKETWHIKDQGITPLERTQLAKQIANSIKALEEETRNKHLEASSNSKALWDQLSEHGTSLYLERKQVQAFGIRFGDGYIAIPLLDVSGQLWSLQKIWQDGTKRFSLRGKVKGCFHLIGTIAEDTPIYITEGYATGASIHMATHQPVVVAFHAGNLDSLMEAIKGRYPHNPIVLAADDDCWKDHNVGRTTSQEIKNKYNCKVAFPKFKNVNTKPTDFNDLHTLEGLEEIKRQLALLDDKPKLVVITMKDFLTKTLPPRQLMLDPWLTTQSLNMIYAWRGIGKTHVALGIAYAVASGSTFLNWKADKPRGVLYLDGEMPGNALQERLLQLAKQENKEFPADNFRLVTPDLQNGTMPDLATPEGQELIDSFILPSTELIIVDNLSCLLRGEGRENEAESWVSCGQWALSKRAQGKSVIFIHHAGKNGNQRGTSRREDILDTVIVLKRPSDYESGEGARFEIHFEKARHLHGKNVEPFVAKLLQDEHKNQAWKMQPLAESRKAKIIDLHREGISNKEIANELEIDLSTVYRILNKAEEEESIRPTRIKGKSKNCSFLTIQQSCC